MARYKRLLDGLSLVLGRHREQSRVPVYDAFISYSHSGSGQVAKALQRELERFTKPWYQSRRPVVFRDETNLAANPELWPSIEAALARSDWLVLMASPEARDSPWIQREVEWWLANRSANRILIAQTAGEIVWRGSDFDWQATNSLPPALTGALGVEPLWVDLRSVTPGRGSPDRQVHLGDLVAEFAAPIHGVSKDDLIGAHLYERRRTRRTVQTVIIALCILLLAAVAGGLVALDQRNEAVRQRDVAWSQRLMAEADSIRDQQPRRALMLGIAATSVDRTEPGRLHLLENLARTNYVGALVGHTSQVSSVAFAHNGQIAAMGTADGAVALWDVSNMTRPHRLTVVRGHDQPVTALAFSPDGQILASGSIGALGGAVVLWNVADASEPREFATLACPIDSYFMGFGPGLYALAFSPDGHLLPAGTVTDEGYSQGDLFLWSLSAGVAPRQLATFDEEGNVWSVAFSPHSHTLAVGIESETPIRFYDVDSSSRPRLLATISNQNKAFTEGFPDGHDVRLFCVAYSTDGKTLASVANDRIAVLWDTTDRHKPKQIGRLRGHEGDVWSAAFAPDGQTFATRSNDGKILVWDVRNRADPILTATIPGQSGWWTAMAFSPDGHTLLTSSDDSDNSAVLWDTRNRTELHLRRLAILTRPGSNAAVFGTSGRVLATGSTDYDTPSLWDVSNNSHPKRLALLRPNGARLPAVSAIAMTRDGTRLATATLAGQRCCGTWPTRRIPNSCQLLVQRNRSPLWPISPRMESS